MILNDSFSVDSILLLEEGFDVFSSDASDKMLKYALKERWSRRKEPAFDKWGKLTHANVVFVYSTGRQDFRQV